MSYLSDIKSYWQATAALNDAIPVTKVFVGLQPSRAEFPYVVITPISTTVQPTTSAGYVSTYSFQISVFGGVADADGFLALVDDIAGQFDYKTISASTISCERSNGPVLSVDQSTPQKVYQATVDYDWLCNRSLPDVV